MARLESGAAEREAGTLETWLEFLPSVLMALAVIFTAYSAYEATRWGGVQATEFATASSLRTQANSLTTVGVTQISYDAGVFGELALAFRNEDLSDPAMREEAARFAEILTRDEFKPFFEEWLALDPANNPDAPGTPFDLPSYSNANLDEAEQLTSEAEVSFEEAKEANQNGDDYILATIFFAAVLFFSGLRLSSAASRSFVLVLAATALIVAIVRVSTLPFQ